MVLDTNLYVRTTVAISGINIMPKIGLYNGARDTLIDFIYKDVYGPNNQHGPYFPEAAVVDFSGLKLGNANPWDKNNPTERDNTCSQNIQTHQYHSSH